MPGDVTPSRKARCPFPETRGTFLPFPFAVFPVRRCLFRRLICGRLRWFSLAMIVAGIMRLGLGRILSTPVFINGVADFAQPGDFTRQFQDSDGVGSVRVFRVVRGLSYSPLRLCVALRLCVNVPAQSASRRLKYFFDLDSFCPTSPAMLKRKIKNMNMNLEFVEAGVGRPFGTRNPPVTFQALKRLAILRSPSGTTWQGWNVPQGAAAPRICDPGRRSQELSQIKVNQGKKIMQTQILHESFMWVEVFGGTPTDGDRDGRAPEAVARYIRVKPDYRLELIATLFNFRGSTRSRIL